jgi:peptidoglycan/xylan/chitin deacetylase (PgdA/CDA1 family)
MTFIAPHYQKANKRSWLSFFRKDHFLVKTPWWLKKLYPGCLWDMKDKEKKLYITFDDGPHPTITPFVMDQLNKHNAKATFFCIGENVEKNPEAFELYKQHGHSTGNHTQHHINGWKSSDEVYLNDITEASKSVDSTLFRPPYGRMKKSQVKKILQKDPKMKIVMWNILAGDWVPELTPEKCYRRIKKKINAGDIIVLHESDKSWERMSYVLPRLLEDFSRLGYTFHAIPEK